MHFGGCYYASAHAFPRAEAAVTDFARLSKEIFGKIFLIV
jgi:hypothetical protein